MVFLRHLVLIVFFLLDIADFISDWLLYHDVATMEKGLVYGPPSQDVVWAFLAFSIVGTVTFLAECIILRYEWKKAATGDHVGLIPDIISVVVIWIEDIPQVIISFSLALCRQDAISVFQLSKAVVVIVGSFIRLATTCIRFRLKDRKLNTCTFCVKAFLLTGMIIELGFSSGIFVLNHTSPPSKGDIMFRVPTTIMEETFETSPYLDNVSLFVHHKDLFDTGNANDMSMKDPEVYWLRLFSINNLREDDAKLLFNIEYEFVSERVVNMAILVQNRYTTDNALSLWAISGCYTINQTSAEITEHPNVTCSEADFFSRDSSNLLMRFRFEHASQGLFRRRPIGEIYSNMKLWQNGTCSSVEYTNYPPPRNTSQRIPLTFHYFQVSDKVDSESTKHLLNDTSGSPRFFRNVDTEMMDVRNVWKTGWTECETTGSTNPVKDPYMWVDCGSRAWKYMYVR